jgi:type VI secretion system secreted protein Hcp
MFFNKMSVLSTLAVASVLAAALPARAQNGDVMFVTSANPKGSASITGKEGSRVLEVRHSVVSPRDPQSGLPTGQRKQQSGQASGKRQWKPITILKEVDSASPKLWQALKQNEVLQVKLELNSSGKTVRTIELQGATIANIRKIQQGEKPVEEIELNYQKIEVTYRDGKKSYADDWEAR